MQFQKYFAKNKKYLKEKIKVSKHWIDTTLYVKIISKENR